MLWNIYPEYSEHNKYMNVSLDGVSYGTARQDLRPGHLMMRQNVKVNNKESVRVGWYSGISQIEQRAHSERALLFEFRQRKREKVN